MNPCKTFASLRSYFGKTLLRVSTPLYELLCGQSPGNSPRRAIRPKKPPYFLFPGQSDNRSTDVSLTANYVLYLASSRIVSADRRYMLLIHQILLCLFPTMPRTRLLPFWTNQTTSLVHGEHRTFQRFKGRL